MTKIKTTEYIVLALMLIQTVVALNTCIVVGGTGNISNQEWYDQTFQGHVIENTSVNITVEPGGGWVNISCITAKPYGTYVNLTNSSISHNITFCNNIVSVPKLYNIRAYPLNYNDYSTECNFTFTLLKNTINSTIIEIRPNEHNISSASYPLIYIGASALAGGTILYLLRKRRS